MTLAGKAPVVHSCTKPRQETLANSSEGPLCISHGSTSQVSSANQNRNPAEESHLLHRGFQ